MTQRLDQEISVDLGRRSGGEGRKRRASCQKLAKRTDGYHDVSLSAADIAPVWWRKSRHDMTAPRARRAVFRTPDRLCRSVSISGAITGNWKPRRDSNPRARFRKQHIAGLDGTGRHLASVFYQSQSRFLVMLVYLVHVYPPCSWHVFHVQVAKNLPKNSATCRPGQVHDRYSFACRSVTRVENRHGLGGATRSVEAPDTAEHRDTLQWEPDTEAGELMRE